MMPAREQYWKMFNFLYWKSTGISPLRDCGNLVHGQRKESLCHQFSCW